jgi:hypothetical protein
MTKQEVYRTVGLKLVDTIEEIKPIGIDLEDSEAFKELIKHARSALDA